MQTLYRNVKISLFEFGGVQRLSGELNRCSKKYRDLFNGNYGETPQRVRTIFQEIRETPTINECRLKSLKILNSLLIFFNQNDYPITKQEFNDLQVDDLISIYELLLEQNLYKKREMERVKT